MKRVTLRRGSRLSSGFPPPAPLSTLVRSPNLAHAKAPILVRPGDFGALLFLG